MKLSGLTQDRAIRADSENTHAVYRPMWLVHFMLDTQLKMKRLTVEASPMHVMSMEPCISVRPLLTARDVLRRNTTRVWHSCNTVDVTNII